MRPASRLMLAMTALSALVGCSASPLCPSSPPPAPTIAVPWASVGPAASSCPSPAGSDTVPHPIANRCFPEGRRPAPAAPGATDMAAKGCRTLEPAVVQSIDAELRKSFTTVRNPARVVVDFDCDPTVGELREVDVESAVGHGWSLLLWRIRPIPERGGYSVLGLKYWMNGPTNEYDEDMQVLIARGELSSSSPERVVERSRTTLAATIHALPLRPADPHHRVFPTRSRSDIHYLLRVLDSDGAVLERHFTDYVALQDQGPRLVLQAASDPLIALLEKVPFQDQAPTDDDREFFVRSFLATWRSDSSWWIRERYLSLASRLGTRELLPDLIAVVGAEVGPEMYSESRQRIQAINAVAAITGWDLRFDEEKKPRPPERVAAEYFEECGH